MKSYKGKEPKAKALRKGKVVEPLQEENPEIPNSKDHQAQEADLHPNLSIDVRYDESDIFSPTSTEFFRRRRKLFSLTESISTEETHLMDE